MKMRRFWFVLASLLLLPRFAVAHDQEHPPIEIWSSAAGGGQLVTEFDFSEATEVYETFCLEEGETCLFTSIDPGFLAPVDDETGDDFFVLADGTSVTIEIVSVDDGLTLSVNGNRLDQPGESARLGTAPNLHLHPSWQLLTDAKEPRDFHISYRLVTDSPSYQSSVVLEHTIRNVTPVEETPTPTPTPPSCAGDCDGSGDSTVDEILLAVNAALGLELPCPAADLDDSGEVTVDEIIAAVEAALSGCAPTPPHVSFQEVQQQIFDPVCVDCHNSVRPLGGLDLSAAGSHGWIVNRSPANFAAAASGMLLVDPGDPANSFLFLKLTNPRPEHGGRMPLELPPLTTAEIELIRNWILGGAHDD